MATQVDQSDILSNILQIADVGDVFQSVRLITRLNDVCHERRILREIALTIAHFPLASQLASILETPQKSHACALVLARKLNVELVLAQSFFANLSESEKFARRNRVILNVLSWLVDHTPDDEVSAHRD